MTKEKKVFAHQPDHWVNKPSVDSITDDRLDYFDRCLLMYMCFRFDYFKDVHKRPYFESTQTLADVFKVHRNTVSKAIQKLKEFGYIEVKVKVGGSNTYTKVTTWLNGVVPAGSEQRKPTQSQPVKQVVQVNKAVKQTTYSWPESNYDDDDSVPF